MKQLTPAVNSNDHIYGNGDALIELVEYGDYQCPYCGRAYHTIKNIQQALGADLKFVFRHFPLSKAHPHAFAAAVAAEAAALQDKFWQMHDVIFENQEKLSTENWAFFANASGVNLWQFKNDIQKIELLNKVENDFESGLRSGVNGTPSFYINGSKYEGRWEQNELLYYLKNKAAELSSYSY